MKVLKRNGQLVDFDLGKIEDAIKKAFKSQSIIYDDNVIIEVEKYLEEKHSYSALSVESIQDMVEKAIMACGHHEVAKAFMIYREKRKNIREYVNKKINFINRYKQSDNTANATIDDNSNVSNKNIAVCNVELHKEENAEINLGLWENMLKKLYPDFDYKSMKSDFGSIAYPHDLSSQVGEPYCVAITSYPFLTSGVKNLGGLSAFPKKFMSFCGMFPNMVFAIANHYKGAVAIPGFLNCMDYFCRKRWGDNYYLKTDAVTTSEHVQEVDTIQSEIHQQFQHIVYSLMQPSGSRGMQSVFWNISIFDKPFFDTMYGDFYFPDGTKAKWESLNWLQKDFVTWLNEERLKCVLTFPVVSACLIYQDGEFVDKEMYEYVCSEYAKGNSFFTYISDSADSLSSCCRLSSKISKPQFNFTNGQLSEMTGSKNVITLNMNRIVQDWMMTKTLNGEKIEKGKKLSVDIFSDVEYFANDFKKYLINILERIYKYQIAYNNILMDLFNAGMLPAYNAGYIDMKKQYLTIGINGLNQAAEYLGMKCNKNDEYRMFCNMVFSTIKEQNQLHKTKDLMFNTEFTPCESAAIKLYNRDKNDGYWVPEDTNLYASYIYKPNDKEISVLDKIYLHGRDFCGDNLDGGSSAHINLDNHLTTEQYRKLVKYAAEVGCKYFTFNVPNSECDDCGYITKHPISECPKCHSKHISYYDRVIGYLTKIKNWSAGRQQEQKTRVYVKTGDELC